MVSCGVGTVAACLPSLHPLVKNWNLLMVVEGARSILRMPSRRSLLNDTPGLPDTRGETLGHTYTQNTGFSNTSVRPQSKTDGRHSLEPEEFPMDDLKGYEVVAVKAAY